ncbi:MAG: tetraacyldisaccharide 4'-kinase [Candidatus Aceula meridiana]|nr:tetraacyldisaccharide 4'-kinase [Candidatus Aceula meridiana]
MRNIDSYWLSLAKDKNNSIAAKVVKVILWLFSFIYGLGIRLLVWAYQAGVLPQKTLPCKVISVGNITLGGSGKTPLVQYLAELCRQEGLRPAILTRGYSLEEGVYDEARLLEANLEDVLVLIGKDRFAQASKAFQEEKIDVFILDDGFQHFKLKRDLDIITIDSTASHLNGQLIPRGFLREPLSALKRADFVMLTKSDLGKVNIEEIREKVLSLCPTISIAEAVHQPVALLDARNSQESKPLSFLEKRNVCCFSAIASPESFEKTLTGLGAQVVKNFIFRDHHVYDSGDVQKINRYCQERHITTIVTTQKDAVKLNQYFHGFDRDLMVLMLKIKIDITKGKEEIEKRIFCLLGC